MTYDLQKKYIKEVAPEMMERFGYKNKMAVPKIKKVVISSGVGSVKEENLKELIGNSLSLISGQKVFKRVAKKAIASFKTRKGSHIGYSATLRGKRMYNFLNKFLYIAIPRKRDFRGINPRSVDQSGNLTVGIKEHIVFPEMANEEIKNIFGLEVTIVTTAQSQKEAIEFFKLLGFPFAKK